MDTDVFSHAYRICDGHCQVVAECRTHGDSYRVTVTVSHFRGKCNAVAAKLTESVAVADAIRRALSVGDAGRATVPADPN